MKNLKETIQDDIKCNQQWFKTNSRI